MKQSDIESSHKHAARLSLLSQRHNWSLLISSCVCSINYHRTISQSHINKQTKQSPRADLISLDSPFIQEPKPAGKTKAPATEHDEQHHDFADAWETLSAFNFSARGWCDGTIDTAVRRLQGLGLQRGLAVLPADQPPFEGMFTYPPLFLRLSPGLSVLGSQVT